MIKLNQFPGNQARICAVAAAAIVAASPAFAIIPVTDAAAIAGAVANTSLITTAIGATTSAVTALSTTISTLINQQVVPAIKAGNSMVAEAVNASGTMQAKTAVEVSAQKEMGDIQRRYRVVDPCAVVAPSRGMSTAMRAGTSGYFGRGGGSGASRLYQSGGGASTAMKQSLVIANGQAPAPNPEPAQRLASKGACETFAGGNTLRAQQCVAAWGSAQTSNGYPDADIRAETLTMGPQASLDPAQQVTHLTISTDNERVAVESFLRNISTPLDLRSLSPGELASDDGRAYLALQAVYQARVSLAELPLRQYAGDRLANTSTLRTLDALVQDPVAAKYVEGELATSVPNWRTTGISPVQMMDIEASRMYYSEDWRVAVHAATDTDLLRIIAQQNAFQMLQTNRTNRQLADIGLALAQQALATTRGELLPELKNLHKKITQK